MIKIPLTLIVFNGFQLEGIITPIAPLPAYLMSNNIAHCL